jgi:hypothetical protein
MGGFVARSVELDGGLTIDGPVGEAFGLFSPLGEKLWVPGWAPELLHPPGATWERGLIFRTREERGDAIWVVTQLDREGHRVEYHRVEPDRYVARVTVRCSAAAEGRAEVRVTYAFVGLSEGGNAEIALMTREDYEGKMKRWKGWIDGLRAGARPGGSG